MKRATHLPSPPTRRAIVTGGVALVIAAALASAIAGATSALWRAELHDRGAMTDAAVLFSVNGAEATALDPTVTVDLGPADAEILATSGVLAVPVTVEALSQGNRGLRYDVVLPDAAEGSILAAADITLVRVSDMDACTAEIREPARRTAIPPAPITSTPVAAEYTDDTTPVVEHWCLRAHLSQMPDEGEFTTTTTITGTHALGEISETRSWAIDVLSSSAAANEPIYSVAFSYATFRAEAVQR